MHTSRIMYLCGEKSTLLSITEFIFCVMALIFSQSKSVKHMFYGD